MVDLQNEFDAMMALENISARETGPVEEESKKEEPKKEEITDEELFADTPAEETTPEVSAEEVATEEVVEEDPIQVQLRALQEEMLILRETKQETPKVVEAVKKEPEAVSFIDEAALDTLGIIADDPGKATGALNALFNKVLEKGVKISSKKHEDLLQQLPATISNIVAQQTHITRTVEDFYGENAYVLEEGITTNEDKQRRLSYVEQVMNKLRNDKPELVLADLLIATKEEVTKTLGLTGKSTGKKVTSLRPKFSKSGTRASTQTPENKGSSKEDKLAAEYALMRAL